MPVREIAVMTDICNAFPQIFRVNIGLVLDVQNMMGCFNVVLVQ
jgi:hypothetical protein